MDLDPRYGPLRRIMPPSYEECVAAPAAAKADYVVSPVAMAAWIDWDEEDE